MSEEAEQSIIKIPLNDIQFGKFVILQTLTHIAESPDLVFKSKIAGVFRKPLLVFPEAHNNFIKGIGESPDLFDDWLNLQIQIHTDLGAFRNEIVDQAKKLFKAIILGTPGGDSYVDYSGDHQRSFETLLLIRMFGKDNRFNNLFKETEVGANSE